MDSPKYEKASDILDLYDSYIFDCDGVLWRGDHAIDKSIEYISLLLSNNKNVYLLTNTSLNGRDYIHKKMKDLMGFDLPIDHVHSA